MLEGPSVPYDGQYGKNALSLFCFPFVFLIFLPIFLSTLSKSNPLISSLSSWTTELLTSASGAVNTEPSGQDTVSELEPPMEQEENNHSSEPGHSRNSSNTSQLSRVSGYSSQHSRQSSSGTDSAAAGHTRYALIFRSFSVFYSSSISMVSPHYFYHTSWVIVFFMYLFFQLNFLALSSLGFKAI